MLEDKLLLLKFRRGSPDALRRIYEKYKDDLLALAVALSNDRTAAEDALRERLMSGAQITIFEPEIPEIPEDMPEQDDNEQGEQSPQE